MEMTHNKYQYVDKFVSLLATLIMPKLQFLTGVLASNGFLYDKW